MLQRGKWRHNSREQLAAHYITAELFPRLSSPLLSSPSCLPAPLQSSEQRSSSLFAPLSWGTWLISGCLCHGLGMTGAGSPSPWQATAQITPLPERANALLMNNKSTLITNCQPNQLALQLSQTVSRHSCTALRCTLPCLGFALLLSHLILFSWCKGVETLPTPPSQQGNKKKKALMD